MPLQKVKNYRWLRELLEILETSSDSNDFLETTRMTMYADQVFAFTPKGDLINLPKGACAIDFAYSIHSKIGEKTTGVRINGRMRPLKTILNNGDQVEIISSKNAEPKASWESFVVSGRARSSIRRFLRVKKRDEYIEAGRTALNRTFKLAGFDLKEEHIKIISKKFAYPETDTYLASVGEGTRGVNESLYVIYPEARQEIKKKSIVNTALDKGKYVAKASGVPIKGLLPEMAVRFPKCCHAVPGDIIVGIVHTGQGVSVHKHDCLELKNYETSPERWLDISWQNSEDSNELFIARLQVIVNNEKGSLADMTMVISQNGANISDIKFTNRSTDFFEVVIDVEVASVSRLMHIMAALRLSRSITSVSRL